MKQVAGSTKLMAEMFCSSEHDDNTKQFVSDVICGNDVVDCPHCGENSLHMSIMDTKRSQAFFCCLNDECSSKFRVDIKTKMIDKL